jgi:hypothetical protein
MTVSQKPTFEMSPTRAVSACSTGKNKKATATAEAKTTAVRASMGNFVFNSNSQIKIIPRITKGKAPIETSKPYISAKAIPGRVKRALKDVEQILEELQKDGKITKSKAQNRMEGIVVPFIHAVHLYEVDADDEELTLTPNISKIKAAIEKGKEDATVRYRTESTIDAYTRDVRLALSGTYSPHASRYVAKKSWGIQVLYGKRFMEEKITGWESTPDSPPGNFVFTFIEQTQEEAAEGSYPLEDADESSEEDKDIVRRIPRSADPISPCIPSVLSLRDFAAGLSERNSQYFKKFAAIAAAFVELPSRYQPLLPLPSAYPLI